MESTTLTFGFLVVVLAAIVSLSGCVQQEEFVDYVEIREYEGERLSSINDFRENSIAGPQHVDKERYVLKITGLVDKQGSVSEIRLKDVLFMIMVVDPTG
jgi:hypothetical protein